jgi:hypothetical protein
MKKTILTLSLLLAGTLLAKGGTPNPAKLTKAGLLAEAIEHSTRKLALVDRPELKNEIQSISAEYISSTEVVVELVSPNQVVTYKCLQFDDFSQGGTVLKKEFRCILQ